MFTSHEYTYYVLYSDIIEVGDRLHHIFINFQVMSILLVI